MVQRGPRHVELGESKASLVKALAGFAPNPNMRMGDYASRTRNLSTTMYPCDATVHKAIDPAWTAVGLYHFEPPDRRLN